MNDEFGVDGIEWLAPWKGLEADEARVLEEELLKEVGPGHRLYTAPARAVARRSDNDDVLFSLSNDEARLAVIHLTWRGAVEPDHVWPHTITYASAADWIEQCMKPDHQEFGER